MGVISFAILLSSLFFAMTQHCCVVVFFRVEQYRKRAREKFVILIRSFCRRGRNCKRFSLFFNFCQLTMARKQTIFHIDILRNEKFPASLFSCHDKDENIERVARSLTLNCSHLNALQHFGISRNEKIAERIEGKRKVNNGFIDSIFARTKRNFSIY
jgi:hypothetical protein